MQNLAATLVYIAAAVVWVALGYALWTGKTPYIPRAAARAFALGCYAAAVVCVAAPA